MSSINYTVKEIPESVKKNQPPKKTIKLTLKPGYKNLQHVNKVNTETFNNSRRDLFKAIINDEHPNEKLRGKNVYLKKIELNRKNQLQCWREMMIGLEIKHDLITNIVDNWIEIKDGIPLNAYYATLDKGGMSFKDALRNKKMLGRSQGKETPISFFQFAKIAQDLITTLIILKKNTVLHRDIIINNVLLHDLHGEDQDNPGPRTELIDFGWAKKIFKATDTTNTGTAGKTAPEISLKSTEYHSLIASKPYSYPVDIFATGQLLAEIIELDRGFLKKFNEILGYQNCGNPWIDESFGSTMFALFAEKDDGRFSPMSKPTEEQKDAMINVHQGAKMPDPESYKNNLKHFIAVNRKGKLVDSDSLSQRYLRNFWFRHLDPSKGWTPERIDMTVDLIMRMLNYWPDNRPTAEELYQHEIFKEKDDNGDPILPKRNDAEGIDNLVKLSNDQNFRAFQEKLAQSNKSKLFMKTKSSENHFDDNEEGPKTTIHEILTLEERIELVGNNVRLKPIKPSAMIDKIASAENRGMNLEDLGPFLQLEDHGAGDQGDNSVSDLTLDEFIDFKKLHVTQPEDQDSNNDNVKAQDHRAPPYAQDDDAEDFNTAASKMKDATGWESKPHTNNKDEHFQVFGNSEDKKFMDESMYE